MAQVSSGVAAGPRPTAGRPIITTARRAGEPSRAYPRMSATVIVRGVILISVPAGPNYSRPDRGEKIANREDHHRLTR
jgi:hypothetical protein